MLFILFAFILLNYSTFSSVYCATIRTISASSFSSIIFSNDLTIGDAAGGNGFGLNLNSQNPTEIIPGRFRLSANPNDDFSLLVNQWDNFPEIPSAGRSVLVQIPFVVTRISGQFRVSSTFNANSNVQQQQQFEFNSANSLYTERISSVLSRITMGIFSSRNVQNAGSIFNFNSFSMQNGFRVDRQTNGNGFQLFAVPSNGQSPKDVPRRFRVSVDQNDLTMVRISESNNISISGSSKLNVPSGFRVVRTNSNRFMLRGPAPDEQQFDIPSSEFNVEMAGNGGNNVDITFNNAPSSTMTMMNNNQRNIPNNIAPIRRDKIKSDGTTDCGPTIANLCINPLYAQLMREQCPATCANFPNMAAPAQIQTVGQQPSMAANAPTIAIQQPSPPAIAPVAIQQPAAVPIFPPMYPIIGRIGGANCGKKK